MTKCQENIVVGKSCNDVFVETLMVLRGVGEICAPRGQSVKEILHFSLRVENPSDRYVSVVEPADLKYLGGEMLFFLWNRQDLKGIAKYSDFWNHISDDNETIRSAYGYIATQKYGFDQIRYAIDMLRKDRDTRKAVVQLKVPYEKDTLDNICTLALVFHIRDEKLYMHTMMRGNDIIYGFRYNCFFFTLIQEMIARELGIPMGTWTHTVSSMHIYAKHWDLTDKAIAFYNKTMEEQRHRYLFQSHKYTGELDIPMDKTFRGLQAPAYGDLQSHLRGTHPPEANKTSLINKLYELSEKPRKQWIAEHVALQKDKKKGGNQDADVQN